MRSLRVLTTMGLLLLGTSGCGATAAASVARQAAASGVWVEVSPGSTSAGFKVSVRASCGDNANAATVTSAAFGTLSVQPWNTLLFADVTVPATTQPGVFEVKITCRTGATATTTLTIVTGDRPVGRAPQPPPPGPHTGGGFLAAGAARSQWPDPPTLWLLGGATILLAAGVVNARSGRRRRRVRTR